MLNLSRTRVSIYGLPPGSRHAGRILVRRFPGPAGRRLLQCRDILQRRQPVRAGRQLPVQLALVRFPARFHQGGRGHVGQLLLGVEPLHDAHREQHRRRPHEYVQFALVGHRTRQHRLQQPQGRIGITGREEPVHGRVPGMEGHGLLLPRALLRRRAHHPRQFRHAGRRLVQQRQPRGKGRRVRLHHHDAGEGDGAAAPQGRPRPHRLLCRRGTPGQGLSLPERREGQRKRTA